MENFVRSSDGVQIHYLVWGTKPTALVFVHGWLGNANWWNRQKDFFQNDYTIVQIDLPGHGKSGKERVEWSAELYAKDIKVVTDQLTCERLILVGHSMSGPFTLQASLIIPKAKAVVLVDTVKDMDQLMDHRQAEDLLFQVYRKDFKYAVENLLPPYLFAATTPENVKQQLQREFLEVDGEFAVRCLEPLYKMDLRSVARQVRVPVRAVNSAYTPTKLETIRPYLKDYDYVNLATTGHYPMLEDPDGFNQALYTVLQTLAV